MHGHVHKPYTYVDIIALYNIYGKLMQLPVTQLPCALNQLLYN